MRLTALALLALVGCGSAEVAAARQGDAPAPVAETPDAAATLPEDAPDATPAPDAAIEAVDASSPVVDAGPIVLPPPDPVDPVVDAGAPDAAPIIVDAAPPPVDAAPATVNVCVLDTPYLLPDTFPATTLRRLVCGGSPIYLTDIDRTDGTATFRFDYRTPAQVAAGPYGSTRCDVGACVAGSPCFYQGAAHPGTCTTVPR